MVSKFTRALSRSLFPWLNGRFIVDSIHEQLPGFPIYYRPHPRVMSGYGIHCDLSEINNTVTWTDEDKTLAEALRGASFAVTLSSNSAIDVRRDRRHSHRCLASLLIVLLLFLQAVFMGIPVINLDPAGPTWPVSCRDFSSLKEMVVDGTACRPPREQFLANLGYTM